MKQFEIEILIAGRRCVVQAEELDPWPDPEGYVRYGLTAGGMASVISVDAEYWSKPFLATAEDAEDYFERINYPIQRPFLSDNNIFSNAELRMIAGAIAKYIAYANQ